VGLCFSKQCCLQKSQLKEPVNIVENWLLFTEENQICLNTSHKLCGGVMLFQTMLFTKEPAEEWKKVAWKTT
jgi:hypothetical protein